VSLYALFEGLVIALILLASLWTVLGSIAPQLRARLLRSIRGRTVSPSMGQAGCGSGCSSCGACAVPPPPAARNEQPVRFVSGR
jgi:hypothetical protein